MKVPIRDWEERFEEQFGTPEQVLKDINSQTVPTRESLDRRDSFLRLYADIKSFISSLLKEERERVIGEIKEIIGEDEHLVPFENRGTHQEPVHMKERNQLRAELRSKLKDSFTDCRK